MGSSTETGENKDADLIAAEALHALGLFRGYGSGPDGNPRFGLEDDSTRIQGMIMFLRLLGEYEEALESDYDCPFVDVTGDYYRSIIAYAFAKGYTNGVSSTRFDPSGELSATMYLTFVLRALGYKAGEDFVWSAAWELTDELGITDGEFSTADDPFTRGSLVIVSLFALQQPIKGTDQTLIDVLIEAGIVQEDAAELINEAVETVATILDSQTPPPTPPPSPSPPPSGTGGDSWYPPDPPPPATPDYKVLLQTASSTSFGVIRYDARVLNIDGTMNDFIVSEDYSSMIGSIVLAVESSAGAGRYDLVQQSTGDGSLQSGGITSIDRNMPRVTLNGREVFANNTTVFLVLEENSNMRRVYIGIANVPRISHSSSSSYVPPAAGEQATRVIYINGAVFDDPAMPGITWVMPLPEWMGVSVEAGIRFFPYPVIIDGEITFIMAAETLGPGTLGGFYRHLSWNDRLVTGGTPLTQVAPLTNVWATPRPATITSLNIAGDVIRINDGFGEIAMAVNATTQIFQMNAFTGLTQRTVSWLSTTGHVNVPRQIALYSTNHVLTMLIIVTP